MAGPIDDSHTPYKRTAKTGPGPNKRVNPQARDWECERGPKTKKHYVQVCTYVGENRERRGKTIKVKTSIAKKKKYNKKYRAWLKKNAHAWQSKGPRDAYTCRKTKVAKCRGWAEPIIPLPMLPARRRRRKKK